MRQPIAVGVFYSFIAQNGSEMVSLQKDPHPPHPFTTSTHHILSPGTPSTTSRSHINQIIRHTHSPRQDPDPPIPVPHPTHTFTSTGSLSTTSSIPIHPSIQLTRNHIHSPRPFTTSSHKDPIHHILDSQNPGSPSTTFIHLTRIAVHCIHPPHPFTSPGSPSTTSIQHIPIHRIHDTSPGSPSATSIDIVAIAAFWAFLATYAVMDHEIHLSSAAQSLTDDNISANSVAPEVVGIRLKNRSGAVREPDFLRPIPH